MKLVITNTSDDQRHELVEVNLSSIEKKLGTSEVIVRNSIGQEILSQKSYDGKLLVDASVRPRSTTTYTITKGKATPNKTFVYGRQVPERKDDIAWENDRCAYRIYGPSLQKSGEKAYGIDIWVKNTPELVINQRYANDTPKEYLSTSIHVDHGTGYDPYAVGPTLGCGAPTLLLGDSIVMPYCYTDYEILDNGPIRFTVKLTYETKNVDKNKYVTEHRIISLDKGSNFNKMIVWYDGLKNATDVAAGIVIHEDDPTTVELGEDYILYADPTDNINVNNSQVYLGLLFPNGIDITRQLNYDNPWEGNIGHALGIHKGIRDGEKFTYYFGAAWSRYDVKTQKEWRLRILETLQWLQKPLDIKIN